MIVVRILSLWKIQRPSQWSRGLRCGSAAAYLLAFRVRIPTGIWISASCECCVLSSKGLCEGPIPRLEESYRVCVCVCVCVSRSAIKCNNNPLHLQCIGRRRRTKRGEKKEICAMSTNMTKGTSCQCRLAQCKEHRIISTLLFLQYCPFN